MADRDVTVRLLANAAQYKAEMLSAARTTETAMRSAAAATTRQEAAMKAAGAAGRAGMMVMKVGAVGVVGGLVLAAKASADFEARLANVKSLSHANAVEMKALRAAAMNAGTGYGYTANQVAEAEAEMIKAGVSLRDIMGGGLKGTLALAAAGQIDVADATSIAASAMTQFQLKGSALPHVADLLAAGADKALGSVGDLGYGLSQVGTTAHQMGMSIEDTTGTLAEFAQAGQVGEKGGTLLNQMLLRLSGPSKQAKKLMDQYGVSIYDANGQMKSMPEIAGNLRRSFQDLTPAQRNSALATIFGSRAIRAANILIADGEKGNRKWIKAVNDQGFAAQQAHGKLDSLNGDLQKLKASGENALIALGTGEQAPLRDMVSGATRELNKLTKSGDLERWGEKAGQVVKTVAHDIGTFAHDVAPALSGIGHAVDTAVAGFNKIPPDLRKLLVYGGAGAFAVNKLGMGSVAKTLLLGGTGKAASSGLSGRSGVVPVYVTNAGFAGAGKGRGAGTAAEDAVLLGGGAAKGSALSRLLKTNGALATLEVGALVVHGLPGNSPGKSAGAGALAGAGIGGRVGGVPGAVAGGVIGGMVGLDSFKNPNDANHTYEAAMSKRKKDLADLVVSYQKLSKQAKDYHSDDKAWVSPAAQMTMDKMKNVLKAIGDETGLSGKRLKDFANGVERAGFGTKSAAANLSELVFSAHKAGVSTSELSRMMNTLPDQVITQLLTPGAVTSKADVRALGKQFGLLPAQVRTLMQLLGYEDTKKKTKDSSDKLTHLNNLKVRPQVNTQSDAPAKAHQTKAILTPLNAYSAKPRIHVTQDAGSAAAAARAAMGSVHDRTVYIKTVFQSIKAHPGDAGRARNDIGGGATGGLLTTRGFIHRRAGGGLIDGPGTETSDSILGIGDDGIPTSRVSVNEFVVNARQYRKHAALVQAINAGTHGFSDGGQVPGLASGGPVARADKAFDLKGGETEKQVRHEFAVLSNAAGGLSRHLHNLERAAIGVAKRYNDQEKQLKAYQDKARQLRTDAAGSINNNPFGNGEAGLRTQLLADRNDNNAMTAALKVLRGKGISGSFAAALGASGDINTAQQLAGMSKSAVLADQKLYNQRSTAQSTLGRTASDVAYGKTISGLKTSTDKLNKTMNNLEKRVERGARAGIASRNRSAAQRRKSGH